MPLTMPFPLSQLLPKLVPGVVAVLVIGGLGFYLGTRAKQVEVDRLEAQVKEYQTLGRRMTDLTEAIDKSIQAKNASLVQAYASEIERLRSEFGKARDGLAEATDVLKRNGASVKSTAAALTTAIGKLPVGSAEREAKIAEALAILRDEDKLQQICTVTSVADAQMVRLKTSFSMGTP